MQSEQKCKVYTARDIQNILGLSKATLYNFLANDPPFKVYRIGSVYRVSKESFDEWFNAEAAE